MKKTRRISNFSKIVADIEQSGTNTVIHGTLFFDRDIPLSVLMKVMNDVNEMPRFGERFNRTTMEFEPLMNWDVSRQIHEIPSRRWRILSKLIRDFTEFGVAHPHTSHESSSCSRKDGVPKTSLKSTNRSLLMQDVSNYMNEIYDLAFPDGAPLWEIHVLRMFDTDDQASESDSQSKQTESPTLPVQPNLSVKKETEENLQCGCIIIVRVSHIIGDGTSLVVAVGKALSRCGSSGNLEDAAHPPDVTMPRAKKRALAQSHQHPWYVKHIYGILAWVSAVIHLAYLFLTYRAPRASLFPQSHPCGNDLRLRNVFRSNRSKVVLGATSGKEERKANGTRRMFFLDPIELSEMKMVGYALNNATVNDIITACIHGSLRRVMLENSQKGCEDELVLEGRKTLYSILAVNLQPLTSFSNFNEIAQERIGNRLSIMAVPLQLENEENATAMLLRITNLMRRLKLSPQRFCYYYGISWARCLSPRSLTMHCSKRFTMNCPLMLTNVVGPPYSCEMNSAKLLHTYFFASPGSQTPISALILSYSGRVYISLMTHGFSEEAMETMQNLPSYILSMWEELRTQAISVRSSNHGFPEAKTQSVKKNV